MKNFQLVDQQIKDLFKALISASRDQVSLSEVQLHGYKPHYVVSGRRYVFAQYSLANEARGITYALAIGYFCETRNMEQQTIELSELDHDEVVIDRLPLGQVGYVTDKLREYGVW